ncbi:MAG: hypothetical protein ACK5JD_18020 [Mangrovibacterium sp.]
MRTYVFTLAILTLPVLGFSQSVFFVNLNAGIDKTANTYYNYNNYEIFDNDGSELSFGADLGYKFSEKVRFRLASRLGSYSYGQYYTGSDLEQTRMTLHYVNLNPHLDFRVLAKGKFELFLSPGWRFEFITDSEQETLKLDGTTSDASYVSGAYSEKMGGFVAEGILKYNVNNHFGVTLSPGYTVFTKELYAKNDNALTRFSARFGIEYSF